MCPSSCLSFCVSSSPPALQNGSGTSLPRPACRRAYGHGPCSMGQVSTCTRILLAKKNTYTFANGKSPSKIFQTHVVVLCGCQSGFQFPTAGPQLYDAPVNRKAPPAFLNSLFCRSAAATACFSSWLFLKRLQFADFDKFRLAHAELCAQISQAFSPWFGPGTLGWTKGEWKLYSYIRWFNSGTHKNGNSFTRNANKKDQQGRVKQIYS